MIRPENAEDADELTSIHELLTRAFGQPDEADLVRQLRGDASWIPELALVSIDDQSKEVVGHIAYSRLDVGGTPALALAPLAVDPAHQSRGVGSALVRESIERAKGISERLILVLGEPTYYSRFGFVPAASMGISGPFDEVAGDAFQAMQLTDDLNPHGWTTYAAPFGLTG